MKKDRQAFAVTNSIVEMFGVVPTWSQIQSHKHVSSVTESSRPHLTVTNTLKSVGVAVENPVYRNAAQLHESAARLDREG